MCTLCYRNGRLKPNELGSETIKRDGEEERRRKGCEQGSRQGKIVTLVKRGPVAAEKRNRRRGWGALSGDVGLCADSRERIAQISSAAHDSVNCSISATPSSRPSVSCFGKTGTKNHAHRVGQFVSLHADL